MDGGVEGGGVLLLEQFTAGFRHLGGKVGVIFLDLTVQQGVLGKLWHGFDVVLGVFGGLSDGFLLLCKHGLHVLGHVVY